MFKQIGSGIHMEMKRFYQKIMDENPNLIKDLKETQKTVHAIQQHTFFKEQLKESNTLNKELIKMEESFINAMEIKELFNGNVDGIRFKIKELKNAAHVAKAILELSEAEEIILNIIIYSSKIQVMDLLYEHFNYIKLLFSRLPSDEDLKLEAKSFMEEYKLLKEKEMKIELGEDTDEISDTDSSDEDDDIEASEKPNSSSDHSNDNENVEFVNNTDEDSEETNKIDVELDNENDGEGTNEADQDSENENEGEA